MQSSFCTISPGAAHLSLGRAEDFAAACADVLGAASAQSVPAGTCAGVLGVGLLVLGREQVLLRLGLVAAGGVLAGLGGVLREVVEEAVGAPVLEWLC